MSDRSPFETLEVLATVPRGGSAGEVRVTRVRSIANGMEFVDVRIFKPGYRGDMLPGKGLCLRPNEVPGVAEALAKGIVK